MTGLDAHLVVRRPSGFALDLRLHAPPGTTVALLGPNGAGKSTAVWAIAGVEPIIAGRVALDGRVLDDPAAGVFVPPEERRVGAVLQDGLLFPHLTVAANVAYAARRSAGSARMAFEIAADWLERLDLAHLADGRPGSLSGGQAQRVGLARALAGDPAMLLLDEPLSALDVGARARVRRVLREHLEAFAGPRILITHDPAEAAALADEVVIVEDGSVAQSGPPDAILRAPRTRYAADLAGLNLVPGIASGGEVATAGPTIRVADPVIAGEVLLTIPPQAVSIYPQEPEGSPRNTWRSAVVSIEALNGLCRVSFGAPLPLTGEITVDARNALGLRPGSEAWIAIKATEIGVQPA